MSEQHICKTCGNPIAVTDVQARYCSACARNRLLTSILNSAEEIEEDDDSPDETSAGDNQ